jgi:phosphonate transport system permease protein
MTARDPRARSNTFRARQGAIGALLVGFTLVALARVGLLDAPLLARGARNTVTFAGDLWPPDLGAIDELAVALLETLEIAFAGTALGILVGVPLALLSTRTVAPRSLSIPVRLALGTVRSIPSLLWAILAVVALGLGPAAGTVGIAAYTTGQIGKLLGEHFEGVDPEVIEAVRGAGGSRAAVLRHAVLPESRNAIMSQCLYAFEYNVRASSILGFVGAGGIGLQILSYVDSLNYRALSMALLLTLVVVLTIEAAGSYARRRLALVQVRSV